MDDTSTQSQKSKSEYWPVVHLRMPPECLQQLKDYAEKRFVGVSTVIRTALLDSGVITSVDSSKAR